MIKICHVCGQRKDFGKSRATTCADCLSTGLKWCPKCDSIKALAAFSKSGNGYANICKVCHNTRNKIWRRSEYGNLIANETSRAYRSRPDVRQKHVLLNQLHKASGTLTVEQWHAICLSFGLRCAYCGSDSRLTMDHVVPVSRGGSTSKTNIIPSCQSCNSSKGNKDVIEWYTAQPFYDSGRLEAIIKFTKKGAGTE